MKISQADANQLLNLSCELVITMRSWGYHLESNPVLKLKDADTGKQLSGWAGEELQALILKIRQKNKRRTKILSGE